MEEDNLSVTAQHVSKADFEPKDFVAIPIRNKSGQIIAKTLIDKEDWNKVKGHPIHQQAGPRQKKQGKTYAVIRIGSIRMQLSYYLHGPPPENLVKDHIDGNTLNNRKRNLRNCTKSANAQNRPKLKHCSSKYIGVSWAKDRQKWVVQAAVNGKYSKIGTSIDPLRCAKQYDQFVLGHYGPNAKTNQVLSEDEIQLALQDFPKSDLAKLRSSRQLPVGVRMLPSSRFITTWTDEHRKRVSKTFDTAEDAEQKYLLEKENLKRRRLDEVYSQGIRRNAEGTAIIMTNQTRGVQREVQVSDCHWHEISKHSWAWTQESDGYPTGKVDGQCISLHKFVWKLAHPGVEIPPDHQIDHIHQTISDCKAESLRLANKVSQAQNKRKRKGTTSKYVGVSFDREASKWRAALTLEGKLVGYGYFLEEDDAARHYNTLLDEYLLDGKRNIIDDDPRASKRSRV